ncbi:hypothetical protein GEU84_018605 [Fertoebacter nigrum]|uniref:Glycosyltransferase family 8 protein n=1 Tax=Fertoeibacter niger TaxID=2656921 RepID=A0A8X8H073_9RHOB|nr:hypothetical protein [Fertoeibacter niger]
MTVQTDVTYVLDRGFVQPTVISAFSLLTHRPANITLRFLLTEDAPALAAATTRLQHLFPGASIECRVEPALDHGMTTRGHVSAATLARLMLPRLVEQPTLYLDGDTLVCRDIAAAFATPLLGLPIAACRDPGIQKALHHRDHGGFASRKSQQHLRDMGKIGHLVDVPNYFNAGVILFDLPRIRAEGFDSQMQDIAAAVALRETYKLRFNDQNWLNHVFKGRVAPMDPAWNAFWGNRMTNRAPFPPDARAAYAPSRADPGLVHFTGRTKPWLVRHPWAYPKRWPWIFRYKAVQRACEAAMAG